MAPVQRYSSSGESQAVDGGGAPPPTSHGQSSLGANLNELDYLLQDLNSAQFMEDIGGSPSGRYLVSRTRWSVERDIGLVCFF